MSLFHPQYVIQSEEPHRKQTAEKTIPESEQSANNGELFS